MKDLINMEICVRRSGSRDATVIIEEVVCRSAGQFIVMSEDNIVQPTPPQVQDTLMASQWYKELGWWRFEC